MRKDMTIANDKNVEEAVRIQHELAAKIKFDDGEKLLQENLNELRQAVNPDPTVQELTVYGLADIAYERGEYQTAEPRLKGALQEYPQSPLSVRGHYRLALCFWKAATEAFREMAQRGRTIRREIASKISTSTASRRRSSNMPRSRPLLCSEPT